MTESPSILSYSSIVSRDNVSLAYLILGLHESDIMAYDVGNAYLNAPCQEKIWFESGPEHGPEKTGKEMVIARDLYGLKSSGAHWIKDLQRHCAILILCLMV